MLPKWLKPRFSLRLFLIAFTLIAILFGGAAHFVYREKEKVRRHKLAVERLKGKGIEFETHPQAEPKIEGESALRQFVRLRIDHDAYPYVGQVMLDFTPGRLMHIKNTEALDYLHDVQGVKELVLEDIRFTTDVAQRIAKLSELKSLSLHFESIDKDAAQALGQMPALEELHLHGWRRLTDLQVQGGVDDESIQMIANHPRLKMLSVQSSDLTEIGLLALGKMQSLTSLKLFFTRQLPEKFFHDLTQLPHLEELTLGGGPSLSGGQLRQLFACNKLKYLELPQTTISQADLRAFEDHPALTDFTFVGDISQDAIKRFLQKKRRRVIRQHKSVDSRAGSFYTMDGDDLYSHDLSSAF